MFPKALSLRNHEERVENRREVKNKRNVMAELMEGEIMDIVFYGKALARENKIADVITALNGNSKFLVFRLFWKRFCEGFPWKESFLKESKNERDSKGQRESKLLVLIKNSCVGVNESYVRESFFSSSDKWAFLQILYKKVVRKSLGGHLTLLRRSHKLRIYVTSPRADADEGNQVKAHFHRISQRKALKAL